MTKASYKAPELDMFLDSFLSRIQKSESKLPQGRKESIENDKCVSCNKIAMLFRDDISKKEYTISGLCQDCQDSVFGVEEDDFEDDDYEGSIN
tara:strand:+ start:80 stop:358 length:279 start_codon:yes stop_codon:yes gene_type:complete